MSRQRVSAPLLSSVLWTLATRGLLLPLSVLQSALLARALLPAGLGLYSALLTDINLVATLLSLGLPGALANLVGARPEQLRALLLLSLRFGAWLFLLPAMLVSALAYAQPSWAGSLSRQPVEILLIAAAALCQYASNTVSSLLWGLQQFQTQNVQNATLALLQLVVVALLFVLHLLHPHSAVVLQIGSSLFLLAMAAHALRSTARSLDLWDRRAEGSSSLWKDAMRIGWRNFLHALPAILLMRIDVYLIQNLLPSGEAQHELGIYQAGVRIAELVLIIPGTLNTILFAKASANEQLTGVTLASAKLCLYIGLLCLLAMMIFGQSLLIFFYGPRFAGSFLPCLLVLAGCCCFCYSTPLAGTLAGEAAYPHSVILSQVAALVVNVAANLYLLPRYGVTGAALASTLAYAISALVLAAAFALRYEVRPWEMLRPASPVALLARLRGRE